MMVRNSISQWTQVAKKQTRQWRAVDPVKAADTKCFDSDPETTATEVGACISSKRRQPILGSTVSDGR